MKTNRKFDTRTLAVSAMFAAMAFALTAVAHFVMPPLFPAAAFLKYDPKDVILAISSMLLGPVPAILITVVTSTLEALTFSATGWIGLVMNVIASLAFIMPGAILYRKRKSLGYAVTGLIMGVVLMTAMMLLWNAFLTPIYMGMPRSAVVGMLVPVFLPFNAIKGALNAGISLLLYKPLTKALRGAKLLPPSKSENEKSATGVAVIIGLLIILACVGVLLLLNKAA